MKPPHKNRVIRIPFLLGWACSAMLQAPLGAQARHVALAPPSISSNLATTTATSPPSPVEALAARCAAAGVRTELISLLQRSSEFLELLPLDALEDVVVGPGAVDLVFDFDGRDSRKIKIPRRKLTVLAPADDSDPLARGKVKEVTTDERKLIVKKRVRLQVEAGRLKGVRDGDLKIDTALGGFAVDLTIRRRPGRLATDERGRILLALDESGAPKRESGRFVGQSYDDWLVVEVAHQEMWIGLPAASTPAALAEGAPTVLAAPDRPVTH